MLWVWLFNIVIWLIKLPFYLLPGSDFMPLPAAITGAVETLGGYTHWFLYLLGDTAGDAFTLVFAWSIPLIAIAYLWRIFIALGGKIVFGLFGRGGTTTGAK